MAPPPPLEHDDDGSLHPLTLRGSGGLEVDVLPFGATVAAVRAPHGDRGHTHVVLGFDDPASYRLPHPSIGATVGRVAGRIDPTGLSIDGEPLHLARNNPPFHLHGGHRGFDRRVWDVESVEPAAVRLSLLSPDGEEGYPGNLRVELTYRVTSDDALVIETACTTDRSTPVVLTHHGYFNLAGEGTVEDHTLEISADAFADTDEIGLCHHARRAPVAGTPHDFRTPRLLRDAIPRLPGRHGNLYFLPPSAAGGSHAARLHHPPSGRTLTVSTDEPCLQLYTGVSLGDSVTPPGRGGRRFVPHAGLCLECEAFPDGLRNPHLGDNVLHPGPALRRTTRYAFSTDAPFSETSP